MISSQSRREGQGGDGCSFGAGASRPGRLLILLLCLLLLAAPPSPAEEAQAGAADQAATKADPESNAGAGEANSDPWQKMNRAIFDFNEVADVYVMVPVAKAWRFVTPHLLHVAIRNFNELILTPTVLMNDFLQLKGEHMMEDIGRIVVNVTFGLVGLIDVATYIGIPLNDSSFDQTLGFWGAPPGPYLVLPLFGPSSVRGGIGQLGDSAGTFYFTYLPIWATFLVRGVDIISWRSDHIEDIDLSRRESLDYYVFMRDAYFQISQARVDEALGITVPALDRDADLYFFDDFGEEDDEELDAPDDSEETHGPGKEAPGDTSPGPELDSHAS